MIADGFDAIVDVADRADSRRGAPVFRSVQQAVDAAPLLAEREWRVLIRAGHYFEKIVVTRPSVSLIGENRDSTVLRFNASSGTLAPDGERWTTWGCATLIVRAPDFHASRLTIENSYDYPANLARELTGDACDPHPQAVAFMTDAGADRTQLEDVRLIGYQDTLFVNAGRSNFRHVSVSGHIDFVFGAGVAVFESCDIVCRARWPDANRMGGGAEHATRAAIRNGVQGMSSAARVAGAGQLMRIGAAMAPHDRLPGWALRRPGRHR